MNAAYGTPSPDTPASRPIVSVKIAMNTSGWITAQATPRTACLYFTRMSRSAKATMMARIGPQL